MTQPENKLSEILQKFGFIVKPYSERVDDDPLNVAYCQHPLERFVYDFSIPTFRILFEVDGEHWHGYKYRVTASQVLSKLRDCEKTKLAKELGWFLVRIPASRLDRINVRAIIFHWVETNGI